MGVQIPPVVPIFIINSHMTLQANIQCVGISYGDNHYGDVITNLSNVSFTFMSAIDESNNSLDIADFNIRIIGSSAITNWTVGSNYALSVVPA